VSGHVFHPGHDALHGITVVLETTGTSTYVGRFDKRDSSGVHLLQVGIHDAASATEPREEYLRRADEFGIRVERPHVLVPDGEIVRISPLGQMTAG
jgi:hypothetical protein